MGAGAFFVILKSSPEHTYFLGDPELQERTLEELEAIGQKLSAWVESEEYLNTLEQANFQRRTPEGVAQAEAIVAAVLTPGPDGEPQPH